MLRTRIRRSLVSLVSLVSLAGCAADSADGGTAPLIDNLVADPVTVAAGAAADVTLSFDVQDAEGDVEAWDARIEHDGITVASTPASPIAGSAGVVLSRVTAHLLVQAPIAGAYVLRIRVHDAAGNASNDLTADLDAR